MQRDHVDVILNFDWAATQIYAEKPVLKMLLVVPAKFDWM